MENGVEVNLAKRWAKIGLYIGIALTLVIISFRFIDPTSYAESPIWFAVPFTLAIPPLLGAIAGRLWKNKIGRLICVLVPIIILAYVLFVVFVLVGVKNL